MDQTRLCYPLSQPSHCLQGWKTTSRIRTLDLLTSAAKRQSLLYHNNVTSVLVAVKTWNRLKRKLIIINWTTQNVHAVSSQNTFLKRQTDNKLTYTWLEMFLTRWPPPEKQQQGKMRCFNVDVVYQNENKNLKDWTDGISDFNLWIYTQHRSNK